MGTCHAFATTELRNWLKRTSCETGVRVVDAKLFGRIGRHSLWLICVESPMLDDGYNYFCEIVRHDNAAKIKRYWDT